MTLPSNNRSTMVYLLTKTLDIALRIAQHQHIEEHDVVWVSPNFKQFIRGGSRPLYCCGEFYQRPDEREIRAYATSLNWTIKYGLPPARTPS